jgi:hypothetical protein
MKPTNDQINDFVNATMQEWSVFALSVLKKSVAQKKLVISEDLMRSFSFDLARQASGTNAKSIISFMDYGRLKDMRGLTHTKSPSVDAVEEYLIRWVKSKGVASFRFVPGYREGKMPTESVAIRRIAWGIAHGLPKNGRTVGKAWYARRMGFLIKNLAERMVTNYAEVIAKSTAQQITENL